MLRDERQHCESSVSTILSDITMKLFPQGYIESGQSLVRVLVFCLILCTTIILAACVLFSSESSLANTVKIAYRHELDWFLGLTMLTYLFLAALTASISLMLIFGERDCRDIRYGLIGLGVVVASLSLGFGMALLPAKAKARTSATKSLEQPV